MTYWIKKRSLSRPSDKKGLNATDHGMLLNLLDHLERAPSKAKELLGLAQSTIQKRGKNYRLALKRLVKAMDEGKLVAECELMRKEML